MKRLITAVMLALVILTSTIQAQTTKKWYTTYISTWNMASGGYENTFEPWKVDLTGLTHIIYFGNGNITQTPPYWAGMFNAPGSAVRPRPSDTEADSVELEFNGVSSPAGGPPWRPWMDSLLNIAHRKNIKVLATLQAVNPTNLNYVSADSARAQLLVNTMVAWCERKHFDGVELDWEGWAAPLPDRTVMDRFVRLLYRRVHTMKTRDGAPGLITISAGSWYWDKYSPSQDYMVNQYNLQLYDYMYAWCGAPINSNVVWPVNPLHIGNAPAAFEGKSYDTRGPLQWIQAGHDPKKIGIGVSVLAYIVRNADSLFKPIASNGDIGQSDYKTMQGLLTVGGKLTVDASRGCSYITGTSTKAYGGGVWWGSNGVLANQKFFATGETESSIKDKVRWANSYGLGGIMTYDFNGGLMPDLTNPLHKAVVAALSSPSADSIITVPIDTTIVVTPGPAPVGTNFGSDSIFVGKGLIYPWNSVRSWAIGTNFEGDSAVVNYSPWGGLQLAVGGWDKYVIVDTAKYTGIRFDVKTTVPNLNMFAGFQSDSTSKRIRQDVKTFSISDKWSTQTLKIPFPWYMFYTGVTDGSIQTVYYDNFVLIPRTGYVPTPADTVKPPVVTPPVHDTIYVTKVDTIYVPTPVVTKPTASISSIPGTTILQWSTCGADTVRIDKFGQVAKNGFKTITLTKTTTYTMTAINKAGSVVVSTTMIKP